MDKFVCVIDTETANSVEQPLPYDFGWAVLDTETGKIVRKFSFVCAEIFFDKELMAQAYFAEKIPMYWDDIANHERTLKKWFNIKKQIAEDCKTYGVKYACAHNASFDNRALNTTQRYQTTSKFRYFMPFGIENDKYDILGDILDVKSLVNHLTMEELYVMIIESNDVVFEV